MNVGDKVWSERGTEGEVTEVIGGPWVQVRWPHIERREWASDLITAPPSGSEGATLRAENERLRAELKVLTDREDFVCTVLGVTDERRDWPALIFRLVDQRDAARKEMAAAKANVRDACSTACAEAKANYNPLAPVGAAQRIAVQVCVDAIAALDMETL